MWKEGNRDARPIQIPLNPGKPHFELAILRKDDIKVEIWQQLGDSWQNGVKFGKKRGK
jgi:hypothetical protein